MDLCTYAVGFGKSVLFEIVEQIDSFIESGRVAVRAKEFKWIILPHCDKFYVEGYD